METKHTKGEWIITPNGEYVGTLNPNNPVCKISPLIDSIEEKANAKLISISPQLLKDAISDIEVIEDFVKRYKNNETDSVVYFLENLLISKKTYS